MKYMKSLICMLICFSLLCGCTAVRPSDKQADAKRKTEQTSSVSETEKADAESETETETQTETTTEDTASSTSASTTQVIKTSPADKTNNRKSFDSVQSLIDSMTLEEKVGQLFMVFPEALSGMDHNIGLNDGTGKKAVTSATNDVKNAIQKYQVGGIVMFAQNITSPGQITAFNNALQATSDIPLFIAVDEEGGTVARLARNNNFNLTKYKSAADVGASGKESDAYNMGNTIGKYLKKYGFNMDFAPVADVNSNPDNPVIGSRSFSADPKTAARLSGACANGIKANGVMPTFKHFPGHGDTAEDSHKSLAVNNHNLERLWADDWLPYTENDLSYTAVMVGHIALPNVTGSRKSAALDKDIVTGYLRNKIGFNGLVVTDSLKMQGVTDYYDTGTAAIMAINAGCDIVLMPQNFVKAYNAVLAAVKDGTISEERLNQSLRRIFEAKYHYGIIK